MADDDKDVIFYQFPIAINFSDEFIVREKNEKTTDAVLIARGSGLE